MNIIVVPRRSWRRCDADHATSRAATAAAAAATATVVVGAGAGAGVGVGAGACAGAGASAGAGAGDGCYCYCCSRCRCCWRRCRCSIDWRGGWPLRCALSCVFCSTSRRTSSNSSTSAKARPWLILSGYGARSFTRHVIYSLARTARDRKNGNEKRRKKRSARSARVQSAVAR